MHVHISTPPVFFCFNSFNPKLIQHGRLSRLLRSCLAAVVRTRCSVCGTALHCYSNTKCVYTQKTNKEEKKAFLGEEDERWPRRSDFLKLLKSAASHRWVGSAACRMGPRQLVLVRTRPEIISLFCFTLAAGLIPASASICALGFQ